MKIAQVAPLIESVPPKFYGGTERVVHYLTEELVNLGHEVTLFASGDSLSSGRVVPVTASSLRLGQKNTDALIYHIIQLKMVMDMESCFDIIHFHTDYLHFPFLPYSQVPRVTTLHGRLDLPGFPDMYHAFPDEKVISISKSQRRPLPEAGWIGTVYHGLPLHLHKKGDGNGGYLAFLGRFSREKGPEHAVAIAAAARLPLKAAAKVDPAEIDYFEYKIKPLLEKNQVEFIGEIDENRKTEFLGNASALLFPIQWPEPFGMVMVEAMACGTPVIAFGEGSVPEIIEDGKTGFIVHSVEEAVEAVKRIPLLDRDYIRRAFERKFTSERMALEYLDIYRRLCDECNSLHNKRYIDRRTKGNVF